MVNELSSFVIASEKIPETRKLIGRDPLQNEQCGRYQRTTGEEEQSRRYHVQIPAKARFGNKFENAPSQDVLAIRYNPETQQHILDALR